MNIPLFVFICLVAFAPMLAALGYDGYQFYIDQQADIRFSDVGHILTRELPDEFKWIVENVPQDYWPTINEYIMTQKAVILGAIFGGVIAVPLFLLNIRAWFFGQNMRMGKPKKQPDHFVYKRK